MIKSMLARNKTVTVEFQRNTPSADAENRKTNNFATYLTVDALYWDMNVVKAFISEQFRNDVKAGIVFDPADMTSTINNDDQVVIDSEIYKVIYVDNIGKQDKVIFVPLSQ